MPGTRLETTLCRRCHTTESSGLVRNEPLCKPCFAKYAQTKVVKRMETFRVRHSEPGKERKVLLPFQLNACSVSLLHILSQHLSFQAEKTGRTGYKLCVIYVDAPHGETRHDAALAEIKARYPAHEYGQISLSHIFSYEDIPSILPDNGEGGQHDESTRDRLVRILNSPASATARQDLKTILQRRLLVQYAKEHECAAILWDDSTTRLAERTLAETAKGRGACLPWIVADGESPHGLPFYYPMRELLTKELETYASLIEPPLSKDIFQIESETPVSTKHTTIDDLMAQYFKSVEQEYPSIVANVVRTTAKLQAASLEEIEQQCELCSLPLEGNAPERCRLCYGCIRMIPQNGS